MKSTKSVIQCWKAEVWVDGSKHDRYSQRFFTRDDARAWCREIADEVLSFRQKDEGPEFSGWRICSSVVPESITIF